MTSVAQRDPGGQRGRGGVALSVVITAIACGRTTSPVALCRLLRTPTPSGLVRVSGRPGPPGVVAQQPVRVGDSGDGHAVLRLRVVDAVPAGDVAARQRGRRPGRRAAPRRASSIGSTSRGQPSRLTRDQRLAAHRVDVGQRVGRGDPAPVVGVVDDRGEEVGGRHHAPGRRRSGRRPRRRRASRPDQQVRGRGRPAPSPATISSSSPGGILQAQPPPWAYWVSRNAPGRSRWPAMTRNRAPAPSPG